MCLKKCFKFIRRLNVLLESKLEIENVHEETKQIISVNYWPASSHDFTKKTMHTLVDHLIPLKYLPILKVYSYALHPVSSLYHKSSVQRR